MNSLSCEGKQMADFILPGAPFLLSLPDPWSWLLSENQSKIEAESPDDRIQVCYELSSYSLVDDAIANRDFLDTFHD